MKRVRFKKNLGGFPLGRPMIVLEIASERNVRMGSNNDNKRGVKLEYKNKTCNTLEGDAYEIINFSKTKPRVIDKEVSS